MRSRLNASPKKAKVSRRERNLTLAFRRVNSHRLTALKCPYMLESACILNIKRYQVKIDILTSLGRETPGLCGASSEFPGF